MIKHFQTYFLTPGSAKRLGVSRFLFYAWFIVQVIYYSPRQYAQIPSELWNPVLILRFFDAPTPAFMNGVTILLLLSAILACLGWFTRISSIVAAISGVYAFGIAGGTRSSTPR